MLTEFKFDVLAPKRKCCFCFLFAYAFNNFDCFTIALVSLVFVNRLKTAAKLAMNIYI